MIHDARAADRAWSDAVIKWVLCGQDVLGDGCNSLAGRLGTLGEGHELEAAAKDVAGVYSECLYGWILALDTVA